MTDRKQPPHAFDATLDGSSQPPSAAPGGGAPASASGPSVGARLSELPIDTHAATMAAPVLPSAVSGGAGQLLLSMAPSAGSAGSAHEDLPPGTTMGRYLIVSRLGEGGMGVVYAAFDTELTRKIAIKILHPKKTNNGTEGRARLLREAQVLAQLSHPHVVTIYDVGTYRDQVFIAMEFIEGGTLTDWLAAGPHSDGEKLDLFLQAGRGLSAAHAANFVHRVHSRAGNRPKIVGLGGARKGRGMAAETRA